MPGKPTWTAETRRKEYSRRYAALSDIWKIQSKNNSLKCMLFSHGENIDGQGFEPFTIP